MHPLLRQPLTSSRINSKSLVQNPLIHRLIKPHPIYLTHRTHLLPLSSRPYHLKPSLTKRPNPTSPTTSFLKRLLSPFSSTSPSPETMSAAKTKAQSLIADNAVVVFSKSWCPYCRTAKATLSAKGAKFFTYELDQVDDGSAVQSAIAELTGGHRSVPAIYIGGEFVGGNDDLQAIKDQLPERLQKAGAL